MIEYRLGFPGSGANADAGRMDEPREGNGRPAARADPAINSARRPRTIDSGDTCAARWLPRIRRLVSERAIGVQARQEHVHAKECESCDQQSNQRPIGGDLAT